MAEKVYRRGSDIITSAIFKQIDVLEEMQETAIKRFDCKSVCELSDRIIKAAESYDRHINSGCDNSAASGKALHGKRETVRPPSYKLMDAAVNIYGMKDIDGLSVDGIIERIREAEIEYWKHK